MVRKGAELRLRKQDFYNIVMEVEWIRIGRTDECGVLTNAIRILSGIGPRNALSIEIFWAPELAVSVLI